MKRAFTLFLAAVMPLMPAQPLAQRIGHTDPAKYRKSRSHGSVGDMACMTLIPGNTMTVNLNFVHRCQMMPGACAWTERQVKVRLIRKMRYFMASKGDGAGK